jgi:MHS family alpha-ketoglutarate permease-like MFS transporter
MLLQPVGGLISDRVGRKPLLIFFGVGGVVYTYVLLTFLPKTSSAVMAFALLCVGYVIITGYTSVNAIVKAELFPAEIRALGVGLGYALANSVFGGTAPMLYHASKPDHITLFIVYVTVVIGVSLLVYIFGLKNKQGRDGARPRAGQRLGSACCCASMTSRAGAVTREASPADPIRPLQPRRPL